MTAFNEKGNLIPDLHYALLLTGFALEFEIKVFKKFSDIYQYLSQKNLSRKTLLDL